MSLFYDDLAIGQTFKAGPVTMDRDRIIAFGHEFDPQPQHLSEEAAKSSMFGELVASGWHTAAVTMRLMVEGACPSLASGAMGAGIEGITWPEPVRPGDVLTAESEIIDLRPSRSRSDRGIMKLKTTTRRADGVVVQVVTGIILVPRRVGVSAGT
jgi:acyl dehydratase